MGYFQQMNMTMKEHTPRVMIAVIIPANSNDGTEIKRKMTHVTYNNIQQVYVIFDLTAAILPQNT